MQGKTFWRKSGEIMNIGILNFWLFCLFSISFIHGILSFASGEVEWKSGFWWNRYKSEKWRGKPSHIYSFFQMLGSALILITISLPLFGIAAPEWQSIICSAGVFFLPLGYFIGFYYHRKSA